MSFFHEKGEKEEFSVRDHHHHHYQREVVREKVGINYQLAWTVAAVWSLIWLWIKCNWGKSYVRIFGLLGESVLCDRLESDVDVDTFLGWCFEIWNIVFRLAPLLSALRWHLKRRKKSWRWRNYRFEWRKLTARFSKSILLPNTTNGKCSGFLGLAWMRNSSRQESRFLNVLGAVVSKTRTQQSAPR